MLVTLAEVIVGLGVNSPLLLRAAVAIPVTALIGVLCMRAPRVAIVTLLVWLILLGTIRRLFLEPRPISDYDPLLLVAPAVLALLVVVAARTGAFRSRTHLTISVLVLTLLIGVSALNPLQGLTVGAAALLFALVPLLWFWVGRAFLTDALLRRLLWILAALAPFAALYGLFQIYKGLPSWDARWVELKGYGGLGAGETLRAFASFASASEYVTFLAVGMVVCALK
ncbi:MAG: hypothetical protein LC808_00730, partial [Actinobacteria bacterium]|nr:hypothetical protein [Actinomycetota bacterium]